MSSTNQPDTVDEILKRYRSNSNMIVQSLAKGEYTAEEYFARQEADDLDTAKKIEALIQARERELLEKLDSEGYMYVPPSYRDTIQKYVDTAKQSRVSLKALEQEKH